MFFSSMELTPYAEHAAVLTMPCSLAVPPYRLLEYKKRILKIKPDKLLRMA